MLQPAAFQVVVELLKHEFRQEMTAFSQVIGKLRQMVLNDLVQQRQLRSVTNIWRGRNVGLRDAVLSGISLRSV